MEWRRAIAKGTFTGAAAGLLLLVALAIGAPKFDELLVVFPVMAAELVVLYAVMLTLVYLPVIAFLHVAASSSWCWLQDSCCGQRPCGAFV